MFRNSNVFKLFKKKLYEVPLGINTIFNSNWMTKAGNWVLQRALGKAYIQQWSAIG